MQDQDCTVRRSGRGRVRVRVRGAGSAVGSGRPDDCVRLSLDIAYDAYEYSSAPAAPNQTHSVEK